VQHAEYILKQESHVHACNDEQSQVGKNISFSPLLYSIRSVIALYIIHSRLQRLAREIFRSTATIMNNDEWMQRSPLRSSADVLSLSRGEKHGLICASNPARSGNPLITLTFISRRLKGFPMRSTRARRNAEKPDSIRAPRRRWRGLLTFFTL